MSIKRFFLILFCLCFFLEAAAQPLLPPWGETPAPGLAYQHFFRINGAAAGSYTIFDLSGELAFPSAWLEPVVRIGGMQYLEPGREDFPYNWNHLNWYAGGGIGCFWRPLASLRLGAELGGAFACAIKEFPNGEGSLYNFLADAGLALQLKPGPFFSVNLKLNLRYQHSLIWVDQFNGFLLSLGGGVSFLPRLRDKASLKILEIQIDPLFASLQNFYPEHPVGELKVENITSRIISDVEIFFFQEEYMDRPTPVFRIGQLQPGEVRNIQLYAVFNDKILSGSGAKPLAAEVRTRYCHNGQMRTDSTTSLFTLYDKNSLIWDDDRKIATYIHPTAGVIKDSASLIRRETASWEVAGFNTPLQLGMLFYLALEQGGFFYQEDYKPAAVNLKGKQVILDSINFPSDTLKRLSGDCDDLTVLYLSFLETVGVETGFLTLPGHILPIFNTKVKLGEDLKVLPRREQMLPFRGSYWVPVEITYVGREDFLSAWQEACRQWEAVPPDERHLYATGEAQKVYKPVLLQEEQSGLDLQRLSGLDLTFREQLDKLAFLIQEDYNRIATASQDKRDYTKLGLVYAMFGNYPEARKVLEKALSFDPAYHYARFNLGSVFFLQKLYREAIRIYEELLAEIGPQTSLYEKLLRLLSRSYLRLSEYEHAAVYTEKLSILYRDVSLPAGRPEQGGAETASALPPDFFLLFSEEGLED